MRHERRPTSPASKERQQFRLVVCVNLHPNEASCLRGIALKASTWAALRHAKRSGDKARIEKWASQCIRRRDI
jgi:hypothetical protein